MTHPGEVEPGPPGGERYLCPLCDWYLDVPPAEVPPRLRPTSRPLASLDDVVRETVRQHAEDVDTAIREHLVEAHTAPVILSR